MSLSVLSLKTIEVGAWKFVISFSTVMKYAMPNISKICQRDRGLSLIYSTFTVMLNGFLEKQFENRVQHCTTRWQHSID